MTPRILIRVVWGIHVQGEWQARRNIGLLGQQAECVTDQKFVHGLARGILLVAATPGRPKEGFVRQPYL